MNLMIINCTIDMVSVAISMIAILLVFMFSKINKTILMQFFPVFFFNGLMGLSNFFGQIYRGDMTPAGLIIIPIANFGEFLFAILTSAAFLYYLISSIEDAGQNVKYKYFFFLPYLGYILLLMINLFHPMFYTVDAANVYHRLEGYSYLTAYGTALIAENFLVYLIYLRSLPKMKVLSSLFYFISPITGALVQNAYYGIVSVQLCSTVALMLIYVLIVQYALESYLEKQHELQTMRTKAMLSQISPHFIFNVLSTISALCHNKAPLAEKAVITFTRYLRGNIDALSSEELIPFTEEMEHVKHYFELEQLRFEERVMADADLQDTDFLVPPLSIQPLVENAVKHGITKKEDGGLIEISSFRDNDMHVVVIKDDGIGFDPNEKPKDNKVHVGLSSSKERFETLLHAQFEVNSVPGEGTTITIRIPVQNEKRRK